MSRLSWLALAASVSLAACMTNTPAAITLNDTPARMGVGAIELGQRWAEVMSEAEQVYAAQPVCEARKIAKRNSRRAYLLETCTYEPADATLSNLPVRLVRHYFIDQILLRIDVGLIGDDADLTTVESLLSARYGDAEAMASDDAGTMQWQADRDEAALRLGSAAPMSDEQSPVANGKRVFGEAPADADTAPTSAATIDETGLVMIYMRDIQAASEANALAGW